MRLFIYSLLQTTLISIICSYFGQILLEIVDFNKNNYLFLLIFVLPIFLLTKYSNSLVKEDISIPYFIDKRSKKVNAVFTPVIIINTLLSHLCGMSVDREGVAVQVGGAIGSNLGSKVFFCDKEKNFLIRLGMICGFSALFHSYLTAVAFILELLWQKQEIKEKITNILFYIIFSCYASYLSLFFGLEKFFVFINVEKSFVFSISYLNVFLFELLLTILAVLFILLRKQIKKIKNKFLILFIIVLAIVVTGGRYNSLGINFINDIFNGEYIFKY
ncbi:chloride channel protein [Gemella sp. GH3]|nr:chloride channel protein [Gemella sp. GH3.1]NYS51071.1 chloride channel protein [Gemella sp. GH3]